MHPAFAILSVFAGCGSNAVFLELLSRSDPGSGIFITFSQFLFIAVEGFVFTTQLGTKKRIIPIKNYLLLVFLFFMANVTNNYALKFNISMPLHMIFRSGSLITNMILGIILLHRKYNLTKYLSVIMVTFGIAICTIVSRDDSIKQAQTIRGSVEKQESNIDDYFTMMIGILLLTAGLVLSSLLGLSQEALFTKFGKHPTEAMYYSHLLPLPGFLFLLPEMHEHVVMFSNSEPYNIPLLGFGLPCLWLYLLGNVTTQYACTRAVYTLQTECTSLTVTLVVTLRKFLSLLFSIFYFRNPFTLYHWFGTALVFVGTLLFMDIFQKLMDGLRGNLKKTN